MHTSVGAQQLSELLVAARTLPCPAEFPERLLAVLGEILVSVGDLRDLVTAKVKEFYVVEEVAALTGRSDYTVRRWIKEGRIIATRVDGTGPKGRLLIARSEVVKLVPLGRAGETPDIAVR
jgi:excisionase family DNA binding protein